VIEAISIARDWFVTTGNRIKREHLAERLREVLPSLSKKAALAAYKTLPPDLRNKDRIPKRSGCGHGR
jgi:hypothetical protein